MYFIRYTLGIFQWLIYFNTEKERKFQLLNSTTRTFVSSVCTLGLQAGCVCVCVFGLVGCNISTKSYEYNCQCNSSKSLVSLVEKRRGEEKVLMSLHHEANGWLVIFNSIDQVYIFNSYYTLHVPCFTFDPSELP